MRTGYQRYITTRQVELEREIAELSKEIIHLEDALYDAEAHRQTLEEELHAVIDVSYEDWLKIRDEEMSYE